MDNLFGKEDDSGNDESLESDLRDDGIPVLMDSIEKKDVDEGSTERELVPPVRVKEDYMMENDYATSSQSQSDNEESNAIEKSSVTSVVPSGGYIKSEIEFKDDHEQRMSEDIFENDIMIPNVTPSNINERRESKEKSKRELEEEEREKMQVLVSNFTEDQLDRYEMYRRAAFPKAAIKRIMQTITGCSVSQNVVIAMSGIAKVFVGEIVEEALDVMETHEETGPLQPKHLREAVRRLRLLGQIPNGRAHKSFFRL
ncbi:transcription initiation factor TFIID subunit 11 isoform X2 [Belonocnema kinseyi]|nr:transcription initiation factor TFIID subunit 11 isoform X2 [Belonocnema kinseyi]